MGFKKIGRVGLAAAAVVSLPVIGHAQSSVTIYGVADAAIRFADGVDAGNAANNRSTQAITSGTNTTSRFGWRGTEDLGGGWRATFNFESGLNMQSGTTASSTKLFDRASVIGLSGPWGGVTLGRQTTVLADAVGPVDPLSSRFAGYNPNVGIAGLSAPRLGIEYGPAGSSSGSYRLDSSIKYTVSIDKLRLSVMTTLADKPASSKLGSSGVGAFYDGGNWQATLAYAEFLSAANLKLTGTMGGVSAKVGPATLKASYGQSTADTSATAKTEHDTYGLGVVWPLTGDVDLVLTHYKVDRARTGQADDGFDRSIAFAEYKLSKRSLVYLEADSTRWRGGYQGAGNKSRASGLALGVKHTF